MGRSTFELDRCGRRSRHAVRLCRADAGMSYRLDGDVYRLACLLGGSQECRTYLGAKPMTATPGTLVGRVGLERCVVQIDDVIADPDDEFHKPRRLGGQRTMLGVPMLSDGVVGVNTLWRFGSTDSTIVRSATSALRRSGSGRDPERPPRSGGSGRARPGWRDPSR